jgi:multidrug efflux pump subunit AcrA (membrane-fusion protein)
MNLRELIDRARHVVEAEHAAATQGTSPTAEQREQFAQLAKALVEALDLYERDSRFDGRVGEIQRIRIGQVIRAGLPPGAAKPR